jgi:hypothetical protein
MEASGRIERALDEAFAARDAEASSLVRAALRVAVLRQDAIAEYWLTLELEGTRVGVAKSEGHVDAVRRLDALLGPEESKAQRLVVLEAHIARRRMGAKESDGIMSVSVSEIELHGKSMQDIYDEAITPGMSPQDTALAVTRRDTARGTLLPTIVSNRAMVGENQGRCFWLLAGSRNGFGERTNDARLDCSRAGICGGQVVPGLTRRACSAPRGRGPIVGR